MAILTQKKGLLLIALLVIGASSIFFLGNYRDIMLEQRKEEARLHVLNAYELFHYYSDKAQAGELTEAQAKKYAAESIRKISPSDTRYYWINDMHPNMIMHVKIPDLEEQDLTNYAGPDGFRLFVAMTEVARKDGSGFLEYMWNKPESDDPSRLYSKLSYIKLYEPWGWILGSGVYYDDITDAFWRSFYIIMGISLVLLLFFWALSITVSEGFKK